jgi:hypothetical protein
MESLVLSVIRTDGGTQARVSLNQSVVNEYADALRDGDKFPPVAVFFDGSDHWLADGFHRYFAHKTLKFSEIPAEIHQGTKDDAILFAFQANKSRGLRMGNEDLKSIVLRMTHHPVWKDWTNSAIASHIGVSAVTVGRIKKALGPQPGEAVKKKYINKHGKESLIDTTNLTTKAKEEPPPPPPPKEEGADPDLIHDLSETITVLSEENTLLKDKIAIGQWDASEIEKLDIEETVRELRAKVKLLEMENETLRTSRDMYMNRNAELTRTVKSMQAKLKKLEAA